MPINHFSFDHNQDSYHEGAYCPIDSDYSPDDRHIIYWETHVGLCLHEREVNYYDDIDFYMLVWDEEEQMPKEILFATTRRWTYPSFGSFADATEEVRAKYVKWDAEQRRRNRIQQKWDNRRAEIQDRKVNQ